VILRARWVVPISGPPLRDAAVRIAGKQIASVGLADAVVGAQPVIDLGAAILTPGLVNPHTHLELTAYRGRLPPGSLWFWLARLVLLRRMPGQRERERQAVADGAWESLRAGVTCVGDISRRNLSWPVLKTVPIRKVCFVELLTLADDPPRDPAELRRAVEEVGEDDLLTVGVTPHTPYTVPVEHMRAAIAMADELRRPWCTHWLETLEERRFLEGSDAAFPAFVLELLGQCGVRSPRRSPLDVLESCTVGRRPGLLAHGNYLEAEEMGRLAAAGHAVVYCPRAHRFFGHAAHPYRELLQAGVRVVIGTDSAASSGDLSVLNELRFLRDHDPQAPGSDDLLRMVTLDAASALGLGEQIGSLEPGKQADLAAFPAPPDESPPADWLVRAAPAPLGVWVAGRRVV